MNIFVLLPSASRSVNTVSKIVLLQLLVIIETITMEVINGNSLLGLCLERRLTI